MKKFLLPALLLLATLPAFSQTVSDVLRYSYLNPGGTARSLGAGGAFGALGADYSTLSQNPAGLAMFRTNEFVFTPALKFANTNASLDGQSFLEEQKSNFHFDNLGMVFNTEPIGSQWRTFNVGIGFNRINNFHQSIYYEGQTQGTIMQGFFDEAAAVLDNGGSVEELYPFTSRLGWDAYAFYLDSTSRLSYDFAGYEDATLERNHSVITSGSMNEMVLSFAGNFDEKLMFGATVGVPFVNYRLDGVYIEKDPGGGVSGNVPYFQELEYTDNLHTQGIGVNLKLGVIYRVTQSIRIGGAFHTPTLIGLTDSYSNTLRYVYEDANGISDQTAYSDDVAEGNTDYRLRTPWRAIASGAFLFQKYGFLSADVEFVDYGANRYNLTADISTPDRERDERDLNRAVQQAYRQTMNIRVGGELAIDKFRLRGGVNLNGNPDADKTDFRMAYSGGVGVRSDWFYLDLGVRLATGTGSVAPYFGSPAATLDSRTTDVLLTVGFKF